MINFLQIIMAKLLQREQQLQIHQILFYIILFLHAIYKLVNLLRVRMVLNFVNFNLIKVSNGCCISDILIEHDLNQIESSSQL